MGNHFSQDAWWETETVEESWPNRAVKVCRHAVTFKINIWARPGQPKGQTWSTGRKMPRSVLNSLGPNDLKEHLLPYCMCLTGLQICLMKASSRSLHQRRWDVPLQGEDLLCSDSTSFVEFPPQSGLLFTLASFCCRVKFYLPWLLNWFLFVF